jgi:hypothetical protein
MVSLLGSAQAPDKTRLFIALASYISVNAKAMRRPELLIHGQTS